MTKREKIILAATVVVAVVGVGMLVFDSSPKKKSPAQPQAVSQATTTKKALGSNKEPKPAMPHITLDKRQEKILTMSAQSWDRDIFFNHKPPALKKIAKVEKKLFMYSGYMEIGEEKFAVINNQNYTQGEELNDWKGYHVKVIEPSKVIILTPKNNPIVINYQESPLQVWEQPQDQQPQPKAPEEKQSEPKQPE